MVTREDAFESWKSFERAMAQARLFTKLMLVGSLRRGQPQVHDVDMVGIPMILSEPEPVDMFTVKEVSYCPFFDWVMENADAEAPEGTKPTQTWAPKNPIKATDKRSIVRFFLDGIEMDVYLADEDTFWPQVVVRTGPQRQAGGYGPDDPGAEQNRALASRAKRLGMSLAMGGEGLTKNGNRVGYQSEHAYFAALCLPYCPPELRDHPDWISLIQSDAWVREPGAIWSPEGVVRL